MKVVLFCGGQGMRMRDYSDAIPKPMVPIGYRPILWHLMKYYAHYGHKEFILCLGYKGDTIKNYFLNYDECVSNDFVLSGGGKKVDLISSDIDDWKITFVDTGLNSNVGQRLMKVRNYVENDAVFLANYADGLTDLPLPTLIDFFNTHKKTACLPRREAHGQLPRRIDRQRRRRQRRHRARRCRRDGSTADSSSSATASSTRSATARSSSSAVQAPHRAARAAAPTQYDGFWACMDTFKEKQQLDDLYTRGSAPWEVWKRPSLALVA